MKLDQPQDNKALHPTAYAPVVPPSATAAGELSRWAAARGLAGCAILFYTEGERIMSWAKFAIEKLQEGQTVQIKPRGHSMKGKVNDGALVTIEPCAADTLEVSDIVLVRVKGNDYLHLVKA